MTEDYNPNKLYKNHSMWVIISANFGLIAYAGSTTFIDGWNYFFLLSYTTVGIKFLAVIQIIYLLWDAFNDPIFGYISDKQYKFTKKYGRRFPWIAVFMLPFAFSMWFIFAIPGSIPKWAAIIWATFALLLYETCFTIIQTSSGALYPDKFRTNRDRKRLTIVNQIMWFIGLLVGIFLPGVFFFGGKARESRVVLPTAAMWLAIVSLIGMLIMLPGMRETPEMIERNTQLKQKRTSIREFFHTFRLLLKNRNFLGYFFVTLGMAILQSMVIMSVPYLVLYIANADLGMAIIIQMAYAGAAVLFVPMWILLQKKHPYQSLYKYAFIFLPTALLPFIFASEIWILIACAFVIGIGIGGVSVLGSRMYWDIIDEACVEAGERKEGAYSGIFTFLQRLGPLIGTALVSLTQILTNFTTDEVDEFGDPDYAETQPPEAIIGIRLFVGVIPVIVSILGFIAYHFLFKLTPEKVKKNQQKMKELQI